MAGQRLGWQWGQYRGRWQRTGLGDQLPVENVGEGTLNAVVDRTPAGKIVPQINTSTFINKNIDKLMNLAGINSFMWNCSASQLVTFLLFALFFFII